MVVISQVAGLSGNNVPVNSLVYNHPMKLQFDGDPTFSDTHTHQESHLPSCVYMYTYIYICNMYIYTYIYIYTYVYYTRTCRVRSEGKKHAGPQPQKWARVAAQAKGTFQKVQGRPCCSAASMRG